MSDTNMNEDDNYTYNVIFENDNTQLRINMSNGDKNYQCVVNNENLLNNNYVIIENVIALNGFITSGMNLNNENIILRFDILETTIILNLNVFNGIISEIIMLELKLINNKELIMQQNNKNRIKINQKKYYDSHKEKYKELNKKYRKNNINKIREYSKTYQENNKDILQEKQRIYREKNKDRIIEYQKKYNLENKDKIRKYKISNYTCPDCKKDMRISYKYKHGCYLINKAKI